jgi:hypothetical protein
MKTGDWLTIIILGPIILGVVGLSLWGALEAVIYHGGQVIAVGAFCLATMFSIVKGMQAWQAGKHGESNFWVFLTFGLMIASAVLGSYMGWVTFDD